MIKKVLSILTWLTTIILIAYSGLILTEIVGLLLKGYASLPIIFIFNTTYILVFLLNIFNLLSFLLGRLSYWKVGGIINATLLLTWFISVAFNVIELM
ncbi:hypothetical protein AUR67_18895 [Pseudoalteromonas sp. XI10]|uniref:hypothetical protein n=1 Tax=Pseudoalteromonas sp. XI10 TaxID=1766621 RepID=UPI0007339592|nr:hypothetical protein [Pseudoalteromonas sp. XI10]KTG18626.1 hypothetical protein AUR67_18895 [Pseudoalteromonas sp. XI10]